MYHIYNRFYVINAVLFLLYLRFKLKSKKALLSFFGLCLFIKYNFITNIKISFIIIYNLTIQIIKTNI